MPLAVEVTCLVSEGLVRIVLLGLGGHENVLLWLRPRRNRKDSLATMVDETRKAYRSHLTCWTSVASSAVSHAAHAPWEVVRLLFRSARSVRKFRHFLLGCLLARGDFL